MPDRVSPSPNPSPPNPPISPRHPRSTPCGWCSPGPPSRCPPRRSHSAASDLDAAFAAAKLSGVTVRGMYDVSGFKADTDLLFWLHGDSPRALQAAARALRRVPAIAALIPHTNLMGVHREAEFNRQHVPAFVRGVEPKRWITVYPFVRSKDWYLIRDGERSRMLAEHGRAGAAYTEVLTNTVAAFALGDYEWVVPIEGDELTDLVDMMRDLRYVDARRHVVIETPFFTGRRIGTAEAAEVLS
ncbi:hydrogen peroxide-dependent heme synthase [Microbacterium elymi]|uniref:Coproheme decarboxylase n=1 Tax=Microbacterium elymi TaxID=2909587 RepID=A0ABY5NMC5_9MICO|nr:hydrogen peroxide-dependent heme synthase [Microbacterium elymi]UUT36295.1 chlorite dismutase family protein [Microbacterium elymi]